MELPRISGPGGDNSEQAAGPPREGHRATEASESSIEREPHADRRSDKTRGEAGREKHTGQRPRKRSTRPSHIPTRKSILAALTQLNLLIATGVLSPSQANAMRANFVTLLDELRHDSQAASSGAGDGSQLRDVLRRNPDLLMALSPLIPDDQLRQYVDDDGDADENRDGPATESGGPHDQPKQNGVANDS